ncbi:protein mono-ADP-ribosyltransferase PARP4-like [Misgurnus anguillicaudatus]|uniref:protein mono-ADP-ribosyltransferase PARP4-like n=1 Tax=Misgurnus anguillicaudatus TaxID=75329 RepID=UPI003CCF0E19
MQWKSAISKILTVPVSSISLNDVSRVEGLLLQAQKTQDENKVKTLLEEVNTLLPLQIADPPSKHKLVSQKLDLCQLIRDILNVSEATMRSPLPSSLGKYRALRCSIDVVPSENPEFTVISQMLQDKPIQIQQILRVSRGVELQMFREELGNIRPLLHSTGTNSFVGILSRGLLLPRVGVEQHGIERTDIGNLGGGIYFSDSLTTSVKYSKPSVADGSRLLLVCDVALGQCKNLLKRDTTLTCAPEGYHSVHGVRRTPKTTSEFQDDEYVVYNTDQIKLKYVVQYTLEEDQLTEFHPQIDTSEELAQATERILPIDDSEGLESTKNPLEEMTAGLLDSSGKTLPLKAVHVRCKLIDLFCEVIIFQTYLNQSEVPIEAKYVFPLEETAVVCGFEAFINGKHVIGKVKEKEQARKEYREAIGKGYGAYLMDQDEPDVFTISVGNLPPGATVLIKVTFITELVVRGGSIIFSLPGSVAPWQQSAALNQTTQGTVEKISVTELQSKGEFSLRMSIEMPYEIINLESSHLIKIKRTDCTAVISTLPGQTLGSDGLQVTFSLSKIHMPRMWVEKHPDKESQACMLVFYPDFKSNSEGPSSVSDVIILLDTSESMRGDAMLNARRIALQVLNSLDRSLKINIISFGTDYKEAFPAPVLLDETFESARKFIMSCNESGGSTELWRPLRSLSLIPPSHGMRNILLISDGHVQNQAPTLQLVRENSCHTRVFTCGLSLTANRHMLRALAQAGGGTYEFFDTKMKHTWTEKVRAQVQRVESPGCRSVAVKWQQFNPTAPPPVQAPSQLHALFSDCHTLVYGFVPHCTQAMLFGDLSGQEIKTMVSTTELQKTKGTFLHKLTARAIIRDYEDGILGNSEAEHEGKKAELKSYITELSKEFSVLSQFTSFVAIEERDQNQLDTGFTDIPKLIAEEDVDILPYIGWTEDKVKVDSRDSFECMALDLWESPTGPPPPPPVFGAMRSGGFAGSSRCIMQAGPMPSLSLPGKSLRGFGSQESSALSVQHFGLSGPRTRPSSDIDLFKCSVQDRSVSSAPVLFRERKQIILYQKQRSGWQETHRRDIVAWGELFQLQHEDGYWECTGRLGSFLSLDIDFFANVFLKEKGICSLGAKAHSDILRLVATLLVLQLIRVKKSAEGKLLQSLFSLKDSEGPRPMHWEAVKKAVDWACWADKQYPCVCSRLEFGWDWESSTRQLLGCDSPLPYSPLIPALDRRVGLSVI